MPPKQPTTMKLRDRGSNPSGSIKASRGKRRQTQAACKRNCHTHHEQHAISFKCLKCGLSFCARALEDKFPGLRDTKTDSWSCPRCSGACKCIMCLRKRKTMDTTELLALVQKLETERDYYNDCATNCYTKFNKLKESYSELKVVCDSLRETLAEEMAEKEKRQGIWKELAMSQKEKISELQRTIAVFKSDLGDREKVVELQKKQISELQARVAVFESENADREPNTNVLEVKRTEVKRKTWREKLPTWHPWFIASI